MLETLKSKQGSGAPNDNFRHDICSEDDFNTKIRLTMLCLSGFELYSRWVPLKVCVCSTPPHSSRLISRLHFWAMQVLILPKLSLPHSSRIAYYMLLSLRKHPFLLALRRCGRFARFSDEERGETDVFAGYMLLHAKKTNKQINTIKEGERLLKNVVRKMHRGSTSLPRV